MILTPQYKYTRNDGVRMYYTKSPNDVKIRKVGTDEIYTDAYDVEAKVQQGLTYEETDIPIDTEPGELTVEDTLGMLSELGVDTDD